MTGFFLSSNLLSSFYPYVAYFYDVGCSQIIPLKNFLRFFQPIRHLKCTYSCFKMRDMTGPKSYSWSSFDYKTFILTETRHHFFWVACFFCFILFFIFRRICLLFLTSFRWNMRLNNKRELLSKIFRARLKRRKWNEQAKHQNIFWTILIHCCFELRNFGYTKHIVTVRFVGENVMAN